jgi:glycogen debranching enzyme
MFALTLALVAAMSAFAQNVGRTSPDPPTAGLELTRAIRSWEFLPVVGDRAALLGDEAGNFEAWVYPLKIFTGFSVHFQVGDHDYPAATLARTLTVRPQSATILYAGNDFSVRETLFVPIHETGAIVRFDVESRQPLKIEAQFHRDFQLMWPAALGGTYQDWDAKRHAFIFGEEQKKFAALVGSPSALEAEQEFADNFAQSAVNSLRLQPVQGTGTQIIVIAGSSEGRNAAETTYGRLSSQYSELEQAAAQYYHDYLARTVAVDLPDEQLQSAYDWSRISELQGLVSNPFLGTGLVAGYRTSGNSQRPGFAWFFGRDSMWTSLALNAAGDFATSRAALDFLTKYQRADGKVPHEIAQGANFVHWFEDYPYGFASADATPLFIIALNDYAKRSGDIEFVKAKWDNAWRAYQFLHSTWDAQGLPQNFGVGHGWVEGGPLLPVRTELYQSGLGLEALRALANLAHLAGKNDVQLGLERDFATKQAQLNQAFWIPDKNIYAFALDKDGKQVATESVLSTVPMWFGLLDDDKSQRMIDRLADFDHTADWGMRIVSSEHPLYDPSGYHFGSVWPLFTGWASVGEYRYHRDLAAFTNLRANALLALDGSLGHTTEVLSGDYYQSLTTASPHQVWSAAMVVSPLLRGLFGLEVNATSRWLRLAPHVPADWDHYALRGVRAGDAVFDFAAHRTSDGWSVEIRQESGTLTDLEFSPAVSLRAQVQSVDFDGRPVAFKVNSGSQDQHVEVKVKTSPGTHTLKIAVGADFGVSVPVALPSLGSRSEGMHITNSSWSAAHDRLTLEYSGRSGHDYELGLWNASQVRSVEAGELSGSGGHRTLRIQIPKGSAQYVRSKVVIQFLQ